jgi:hypothetical protein|tara:strand:- start:744 stop:938 length:195 start_codon:yes stop_codon:yes gene_type:complete
MSNVMQFPDKHVAENDMLQDLNVLVQKYNGEMTNVAMLGCLQATSNFVFLSIAETAYDEDTPED